MQLVANPRVSHKVPGLTAVAAAHRAARHPDFEPVDGAQFTAFAQNASRQMAQNIQASTPPERPLCVPS